MECLDFGWLLNAMAEPDTRWLPHRADQPAGAPQRPRRRRGTSLRPAVAGRVGRCRAACAVRPPAQSFCARTDPAAA